MFAERFAVIQRMLNQRPQPANVDFIEPRDVVESLLRGAEKERRQVAEGVANGVVKAEVEFVAQPVNNLVFGPDTAQHLIVGLPVFVQKRQPVPVNAAWQAVENRVNTGKTTVVFRVIDRNRRDFAPFAAPPHVGRVHRPRE